MWLIWITLQVTLSGLAVADDQLSPARFTHSTVLINCTVPTDDGTDNVISQPLLTASWDANRTHFFLELTGQTLGWMAFGLSPTGQMDMSDVMFSWCDDQQQADLSAKDQSPDSESSLTYPCYAQVRTDR